MKYNIICSIFLRPVLLFLCCYMFCRYTAVMILYSWRIIWSYVCARTYNAAVVYLPWLVTVLISVSCNGCLPYAIVISLAYFDWGLVSNTPS